jgi:hypothetical protein
MDKIIATEEIRKLAKSLSTVEPVNSEQLSLIAISLGCLYALKESFCRDYKDTLEPKDINSYREFLREVCLMMVDDKWSEIDKFADEFFFNSALQRISILNERIRDYLNNSREIATEIRREINRFKHESPGLVIGRKVSSEEALIKLSDLIAIVIQICQTRKKEIPKPVKKSQFN